MPASVLVIIFVHFHGFVDSSQSEMDKYFSFFVKMAHKIGQLFKKKTGYCFYCTFAQDVSWTNGFYPCCPELQKKGKILKYTGN